MLVCEASSFNIPDTSLYSAKLEVADHVIFQHERVSQISILESIFKALYRQFHERKQPLLLDSKQRKTLEGLTEIIPWVVILKEGNQIVSLCRRRLPPDTDFNFWHRQHRQFFELSDPVLYLGESPRLETLWTNMIRVWRTQRVLYRERIKNNYSIDGFARSFK